MVNVIQMLPADEVPTDADLSVGLRDPAWRVDAASFGAAPLSASVALGLTDSLLARLAPAEPPKVVVDRLGDDAAHDAYFHVVRVDGPTGPTFVRSILAARSTLLREVTESPVSLAAHLLDATDRALVDLLGVLLLPTAGPLPSVTRWDAPGDRRAVMPRWIRGHQVFAVLTQGLVLSFGGLGRAVRAGRWSDVARWADLTASLLRGSSGAFVLTGDFAVEDYVRDVRPSMSPPASPICLSGLMSADHRVMVQSIRDLKPALRSLHEHDPANHDRVHAELRAVYDHHAHVCERFVGDRPSLLTAGSTDKTGPALIQQFKNLRLKPFETVPHAGRLRPQGPAGNQCPHQ